MRKAKVSAARPRRRHPMSFTSSRLGRTLLVALLAAAPVAGNAAASDDVMPVFRFDPQVPELPADGTPAFETTVVLDGRPTVISLELHSVRSAGFEGDQALPIDADRNTASRALLAMIADLGLDTGFRVRIEKGIPLGSGMGGSASSAVGAVVAANALFDAPQPKHRLLRYALVGEAVASGAAHGDNVPVPTSWRTS